jgi:hypothetical protein
LSRLEKNFLKIFSQDCLKSPHALILVVISSSMTFSKTLLYLLIETFEGGKYVLRKDGFSMFHFLFFYVGMNVMWVVVPILCIVSVSFEIKKMSESQIKKDVGINELENDYVNIN